MPLGVLSANALTVKLVLLIIEVTVCPCVNPVPLIVIPTAIVPPATPLTVTVVLAEPPVE